MKPKPLTHFDKCIADDVIEQGTCASDVIDQSKQISGLEVDTTALKVEEQPPPETGEGPGF